MIPEIRGRPFQFAFEGVLLPFSAAKPALPVLFRLAKRQGVRTPEEFVPLKARRFMPLSPKFLIKNLESPQAARDGQPVDYRGLLPLCAAYAAHSPRFLPEPESRGRPYQFAIEGA